MIDFPNLFIVGAPKCGTTSLSSWLGGHPEIFLPTVKEPHYFNDDMTYRLCKSRKYYSQLYQSADRHAFRIDASTWYLYSQTAIHRINDSVPNAKVIVCLRDPVRMFPSLHQQNFYGQFEDIADAEAAWHKQEARYRFGLKPSLCPDIRMLYYKDVCSLGNQVDRLLSFKKREDVLILGLSEFSMSPDSVYKKCLNFLGLDYQEVPLVTKNKGKNIKSRNVQKSLILAERMKRRLNIRSNFGIATRLRAFNITHESRKPLTSEFEEKLKFELRDQRTAVNELLGYDECSDV